jgi:protein-S-isoprenylcysteine O-methyltransferase Ste14
MQRIAGWLLVILQAALLVALVLVPRTDATPVRMIPGIVLIAAGAVLGVRAGRRLAGALTPTPVPITGATLRTDGPYARVRHPIYSAVLLAALGFTIALGSWWTLLVLGFLTLFFMVKSRWEDRMLRELHGSTWTAWAARTGGLVPRITRP